MIFAIVVVVGFEGKIRFEHGIRSGELRILFKLEINKNMNYCFL